MANPVKLPEALEKLGFKDISCEELPGLTGQLKLDKSRTLTAYFEEPLPKNRKRLGLQTGEQARRYHNYAPRYLVVQERDVSHLNDPIESEVYSGESLTACLAAVEAWIKVVKAK